MAERGDFNLVGRVWESFADQLESKLDINVVEVTTAVSLDEGLRQVIKEKDRIRFGHESRFARACRQVHIGWHYYECAGQANRRKSGIAA